MSSTTAVDALPYPGDPPQAVLAMAAGIRTGSSQLSELADGIDAARATMQSAWQGDDAAAADQESATLVSLCRDLVSRADTAHAAATTHAGDLTTIRSQIDAIRADWELAQQQLDNALLTQMLTPSFAPAPAGGTSSGSISIGGVEVVGPAEAAHRRQLQIDGYQQDLTDLRTRWQALVDDQVMSAGRCRAALDAAAGGDWGYRPGTGPFRGELGAAIGSPGLIFDDRERDRQAAMGSPDQDWLQLSPHEQAFYRGLAHNDYTVPLVLGSLHMIPELWNGLHPMSQQSLIQDKPAEIGSTEGLPAAARDRANRTLLPAARAAADAELATLLADGPRSSDGGWGNDSTVYLRLMTAQDDWQRQVDTARAKIAALSDIDSTLTIDHVPPTYLMGLDITGRGRAIIASGDPDTAEVVATYVPGTGSELGKIQGDVERSERMVQSALNAGAGSAASITWVGYTSPPTIPEAAKEAYADQSVDTLDQFMTGLRASHQDGQSFRSLVVSHSYGTLLVAHAASGDHSLDADALILVASPGTDVQSAQDLHLTGVPAQQMHDRVFATASAVDPVADTPGFIFSGDPTHSDFGATVFHTEAHVDPDWIYNPADHSAYWDLKSESLRDIGAIMATPRPDLTQ
jgi:Alpha/beta hydrolase